MFNKVKKEKGFPGDWKITIICPIYRGRGKREDPGNYRGISLLSASCDIFRHPGWYIERLVNK
jgi:hypothetical protein